MDLDLRDLVAEVDLGLKLQQVGAPLQRRDRRVVRCGAAGNGACPAARRRARRIPISAPGLEKFWASLPRNSRSVCRFASSVRFSGGVPANLRSKPFSAATLLTASLTFFCSKRCSLGAERHPVGGVGARHLELRRPAFGEGSPDDGDEAREQQFLPRAVAVAHADPDAGSERQQGQHRRAARRAGSPRARHESVFGMVKRNCPATLSCRSTSTCVETRPCAWRMSLPTAPRSIDAAGT